MSLSAIRPQDREQYQIDKDLEGVLVASVEPNSEALVKGLQQGDVIIEVNQQGVTDPKVAADIIAKAEAADRKSVLLLVQRQSDVSFAALRFDSQHDKDTSKEKPETDKDGKKKPAPDASPDAAPGKDAPKGGDQDEAPAPGQTP
jgi:C-terminal processing protease CtpA/Prc